MRFHARNCVTEWLLTAYGCSCVVFGMTLYLVDALWPTKMKPTSESDELWISVYITAARPFLTHVTSVGMARWVRGTVGVSLLPHTRMQCLAGGPSRPLPLTSVSWSKPKTACLRYRSVAARWDVETAPKSNGRVNLFTDQRRRCVVYLS